MNHLALSSDLWPGNEGLRLIPSESAGLESHNTNQNQSEHEWKYKVLIEINKSSVRFALGHVGQVTDEHAAETHHGGQSDKEEESANEGRSLLPQDFFRGRIEIPSCPLDLLLLTEGRGGGSVGTGRGIGAWCRLLLSLALIGGHDWVVVVALWVVAMFGAGGAARPNESNLHVPPGDPRTRYKPSHSTDTTNGFFGH